MAKGSKVVQVRVKNELLSKMDAIIRSLNHHRKGEPFDRSSFIRKAIVDKVKHVLRSRSRRRWREYIAELDGVE